MANNNYYSTIKTIILEDGITLASAVSILKPININLNVNTLTLGGKLVRIADA